MLQVTLIPSRETNRRGTRARCLSGANDQFFLGEKLERTVTLHIHGVTKVAVRGGEDRNDDAVLMVVGRLFYPFANRKFRHRNVPFRESYADSPANSLTVLKQRRHDFGQTTSGL
jgi:hypothetical protein